jgi:hypothetical protein
MKATRAVGEPDRVPWSRLECMYGPATEAPDRLRELASPDPALRERAWYWTETFLWHQGSVYPATVHAVPFLLGLLDDGGTPDRGRLLGLLTRLAESFAGAAGTGEHPGPGGPVAGPGGTAPGALRAALAAGVPAVLPLLAGPDPAVAGAAADLLAHLPERARASLPPLRALCLRELPLPERTTALIALGTLAAAAGAPDCDDGPGVGDRALLERVAGDPADPARWAAAVALARLTGPGVPAVAVGAMVAELAAANLDPDGYEAVWRTRCDDGDAVGLIARALAPLPERRRSCARSAVLRALAAAAGPDSGAGPDSAGEPERTGGDGASLAAGLVVDALGDTDTVVPAGLTPWQRAVLEALAESGRVWASGELGPWMTQEYGLPDGPAALGRLLTARTDGGDRGGG